MIKVLFQISLDDQKRIVDDLRKCIALAPLFQKTMPTGQKFKYLCTSTGKFGWLSDEKGYRYERKHPQTGKPFPAVPESVLAVCHAAIGIANELPDFQPESCLINYYQADGKLGLHQDNTEKALTRPIISISLGDDCEFLAGGMKRNDPTESIILHSGDVLIMSREHRMCFHGVKRIIPNTAPAGLLKSGGRINLTIRQVE